MTPADRELFRLALLRVLDANGTRFGLGVAAIGANLRQWGFAGAAPVMVTIELQYLFDKGFVCAVDKAISPENQNWRITANGRDWLAQNG